MRVVLDWFSCRKLLLPRHVQVLRSLLSQPVREIPSGVGKESRVERWREAGWGGIAYAGKGWKSSREPINGISWEA